MVVLNCLTNISSFFTYFFFSASLQGKLFVFGMDKPLQ